MLRTAEEILRSTNIYYPLVSEDGVIKAIKQAMEDTIRECAAKAKVTWDAGHKHIESAYVDKDSILNLIKDIK